MNFKKNKKNMRLICKQIKDLENGEEFYYNGYRYEYVFEFDNDEYRKGFCKETKDIKYFTLDLWIIADDYLLPIKEIVEVEEPW